jgi:hypothetical protein
MTDVTEVLLLTSFRSKVSSANTEKVYYIIFKNTGNNEKCFIKFNICLIILGKLNKRGSAAQDMRDACEKVKNTEELHLSGRWLSGSVWSLG